MKSVTVVFGREQGQSDSVPSLDLSIHHCLYRGGGVLMLMFVHGFLRYFKRVRHHVKLTLLFRLHIRYQVIIKC